MLKSPKEFVDIISNKTPRGIIASLDVESLFTNVPVDETITMIMDEVYRSNNEPLDIPETYLRELLVACTKEAPFRGPDGCLYQQIDGVAMGSPLGVLFANFYMGIVERRVLNNNELRPHIYGRYIDDIFIEIRDMHHLQELKQAFQRESSLNFTFEIRENGELPFLDIMVKPDENKFIASVYTKETNTGMCLNAKSECPDRYKRSVITSYVNRAFTHCSSWKLINKELERISQVLVNNGYANSEIQKVIKRKMQNFMNETQTNEQERSRPIKLYYKSYMSSSYKTDERVLKDILTRGVTPTDTQD